MQLVQTRIRFGAPFTSALTACRLTFQRRLVTLCACEMLFPNCGPLPQTSQTCAISLAPNLSSDSAPACAHPSGVFANTDGRWANEDIPTLQLAEPLVYLERHPGPNRRPNPLVPLSVFPAAVRRKSPSGRTRKGTKKCSHMKIRSESRRRFCMA